MCTPPPSPAAAAAGRASSLGLLVVAGVHAAWASGSSWPAEDRDALADLVVGRRPFPPDAATWGVVGALTAAAAATWVSVSSRPMAPRTRRAARGVTAVTAGVLALRGTVGLVTSGLRLLDETDGYRANDLRLYSPLCLVLAAGAAAAAIGVGQRPE